MTALARPTLEPPPTPSRVKRFWAKVQTSPDCWLWVGKIKCQSSRDSGGYGRFWNGEREVAAHRFAYELLVGPIPSDLVIDHLCRVRACVNPAHLEPVTNAENLRRGEGVGANGRKTHCPQGHPYDEENTCYTVDGGRKCRTCNRLRSLAFRAAARTSK